MAEAHRFGLRPPEGSSHARPGEPAAADRRVAAASLVSAFPALLPHTVLLCLGVLGVIVAVNLRGVVAGGRIFAVPAVVFVGSLVLLIVISLVRGAPLPAPTAVIAPETVGLLLLVETFDAGPVEGRTLLSLLAEGAVGTGPLYVVVQLSTVVLLALAANTSYAGLPVLLSRLARDGALPHVSGLVPVVGISRLTEECLSTALSMGDRVVAVHVVLGTETEDRAAAADDPRQRWEQWRPDVPLVLIEGVDEHGRPSRVLGPAIARYVREHAARGPAEHVIVLVGEVHSDHWWQQVLFNGRGVCRFRFRFRLLLRRVPAPAGRRMGP